MTNHETIADGASPEPAAAVAEGTRVETEIVRSVRIGPIIIGAALVGAVLAAVVSLLIPPAPDAQYEIGQIAGFMALVGAVIGLGLGAILVLLLARFAGRYRGAAIAVHTDVR